MTRWRVQAMWEVVAEATRGTGSANAEVRAWTVVEVRDAAPKEERYDRRQRRDRFGRWAEKVRRRLELWPRHQVVLRDPKTGRWTTAAVTPVRGRPDPQLSVLMERTVAMEVRAHITTWTYADGTVSHEVMETREPAHDTDVDARIKLRGRWWEYTAEIPVPVPPHHPEGHKWRRTKSGAKRRSP